MKKIFLLIGFALVMTSCTTYTIAPEMFKQQFMDAGTKEVSINNPLFPLSNITYSANNIKRLTVVDKQGLITYLENSPSIEIRVTQKNGKRRIMYFDTVELRNDTLYGSASRFIGINRKIPFDSIVKIEVQDGGKNYHYQN